MNVSKNFLLRRTAEHRSNCSVQWWLLSQFPKHEFNISFWDKRANTVMRSHFGWCYTTAWFSGETFECSFPSCFHLPWKPLTLSGHTQICHRNQWIEQSCPRKRLFLLGQFFWLHWLALFICLFVSGGFSVCLSVSVTGFPVLSQTQQKAWDRGWDDWGDFTVWFLAGTAKLGFWPIPYPIWEQCDSHTPWLPLTQGTHSHRAHKFSPVYVLLRNSFCHVEVASQTEPITVSWAN